MEIKNQTVSTHHESISEADKNNLIFVESNNNKQNLWDYIIKQNIEPDVSF